jgi:hypothetical protein
MIDLGPDGGDKAGRARSLKAHRWMGRSIGKPHLAISRLRAEWQCEGKTKEEASLVSEGARGNLSAALFH